jgi:hypothetical protein
MGRELLRTTRWQCRWACAQPVPGRPMQRLAGHLAFDTRRNYPLPNLFVSMLQRLGIEADRFASSTGTMRGVELA